MVRATFPILLQRALDDTHTSSDTIPLRFLRRTNHDWREDDHNATISDLISVAEDLKLMPNDFKPPTGSEIVTHVYEVWRTV